MESVTSPKSALALSAAALLKALPQEVIDFLKKEVEKDYVTSYFKIQMDYEGFILEFTICLMRDSLRY